MLKGYFLVAVDDPFQPLASEDGVFCEKNLHAGSCVGIENVGANFKTNDVVQLLESKHLLLFIIKLAEKAVDLFVC